MPNQEESRDGIPRKDEDRPSPDVGRREGDRKGLASDDPPGQVPPSSANRGDRGAAGDAPTPLDFDDGDMTRPRGNTAGQGRTWDEEKPSDAGALDAPGAGLSDRNGPSDPDAKRNR